MVTIEGMRAISAAFNSRDVERIVACFAEDGVFCLARGPERVGRTLRGRAAIRQALADRFRQIPDMRWENEEYVLAGDDKAISLWTVRGKGSDGEDLDYQGCDIYRFGPDGKIVGVGDAYAQSVQALKSIETALHKSGAAMCHVVRTRIFVTDISRWQEYGRAHAEFFGEVRPATAMVQVSRLISPEMLVEVEADAIVD